MKLSEAPRPGWYPDPEGGSRLRWWDGGDWSDRFRARPHQSTAAYVAPPEELAAQAWPQDAAASVGQVSATSAAIVDQVRLAARAEAKLAAEDFTRRAREVTGAIPPLISQYSNRFMRYVRIGMALAFIVLLVWVAYQLFLQKSLFDWIGDRIDNLDDEGSAVLWRASIVVSRR